MVDQVRIREVGPRDGLQSERLVPIEQRIEFVRALLDAGLTEIEVASFVSPRAVPAMAGGADVVAAVSDHAAAVDATIWTLVPNRKGAELAIAAGVDHLTITVSASPAYSEKNTGLTTAEARAQVEAIRAAAPGAVLDQVISCCFGSPFAGEDITPDDVAALVDHARSVGIDQVTLADTTGMDTPARVVAVLDRVGVDVGLHLHDTRGTALLNAWTGLDRGVTRFDTALGGLGGSPFAPAAGGNLATEDLVHSLAGSPHHSSIDLTALLAIGPRLAEMVGHGLPSRVAATGGSYDPPSH